MIYIYAAMLLHKAGKAVNEDNVKKVLEAAEVKVDESRVKSLVAALEGVNIDEVAKEATIPVAAPATEKTAEKAEAEEEKKEAQDEKKEEEAAAGLGALFG